MEKSESLSKRRRILRERGNVDEIISSEIDEPEFGDGSNNESGSDIIWQIGESESDSYDESDGNTTREVAMEMKFLLESDSIESNSFTETKKSSESQSLTLFTASTSSTSVSNAIADYRNGTNSEDEIAEQPQPPPISNPMTQTQPTNAHTIKS